MPRRNRYAAVLLAALACASLLAHSGMSQNESGAIEGRLIRFAGKLRLGLSIASFGVYAPSIGDLRVHAQQLVNLLEGSEGRHFVQPGEAEEAVTGLRRDVTDLATRLASAAPEQEVRLRVASAMKNVNAYLQMAVDAALAGLSERRLERATNEMLRAYAFLAAAYEMPTELPLVPGLRTILRAFEIVDPSADA